MRTWLLFMITTFVALGVVVGAEARPEPKTFRDCPDCTEMVVVPAGSFMMGASPEEEKRHGASTLSSKNGPVHKVTFAKPFAIGKYPITVAEFRKFVDETGYQMPDSCFNQRKVEGHMIYEEARGYTWRSPGFPQTDRHPVVCVSWEDAMAYAAWMSKKTGHKYSLPNEAQYEYAARGGTTTSYFWGDERDEKACLYANEPDLDQSAAMGPDAPKEPRYRFPCHDGYAYTSPVGSYRPNPFGLYDMQGNVWEHTADCYNPSYAGAPTDGSTWTTGDCDAHMSHGGSYGNAAFTSYVAMRAPRDADYHGHSWGFRLVRND
jgi:formylglycine-generating enzyme required for sulfatase activity